MDINITIPFFPKFSCSIHKILKQNNFKVIFSPTNKLFLFNLKDPIDMLNCRGICSISCHCGLSYIGQTKRRLIFRLNDHKLNIRNQDFNKFAIVNTAGKMTTLSIFILPKLFANPPLYSNLISLKYTISIKIIIMSLTAISLFLLC